jgi:RNA-directed DNA polymerase
MVRSSPLALEDIADRANLAAALRRAVRGTRPTRSVVEFLLAADQELDRLRHEILVETVEVGRVTRFRVWDPKPRLIQAPVFRERVLQHAVMAQVGPVLDRALVDDTFACRVGKGTVAAVRRAQQHARRFGWYGQLDIRQYFASIDHAVLLTHLERRFRNAGLCRLLRRIVGQGSDTPGVGLPIGALCSQYFANHYLGVVDRALLEHSPARGLVRYMDDIVFWATSREEVVAAVAVAAEVIQKTLRLRLRDEPVINRSQAGLSLCGFRIFPGIVRASVRRRRRFAAARRRWEGRFARREIDALELQRGYDAAAGMLAQVDAHEWRRRQLQLAPPPPECDEA